MKKSKFVYILIFVILLFSCSLGLGIYSQIVFHPLNKTINSPEIIDIAVNSVSDVMEMMARAEQFKNIRNISFICAAVLLVAIILLLVVYAKGEKIKEKLKKTFTKKEKVKTPKLKITTDVNPTEIKTSPVSNTPGQKGYCRNCGKFYDSLPVYCGECGETTT